MIRIARIDTPAFQGRRVFHYNRWLPYGSFIGLMLVGLGISVATQNPFPVLVSIVVGAAIFQVGIRRAREAIRINNEGLAALGRGDRTRAESLFAAAATYGGTTPLASIALTNLSATLLRRGAFRDAATVARAGLGLTPSRREGKRSDGRARAEFQLVVALACLGAYDDADKVLAQAGFPRVSPRDAPFLVPAAALLSLRRGAIEEAIARIDSHSAVLRNTLAGDAMALVEAIEAIALEQLGGAYRGVARRAPQLPYTDRTRSYIDQLVPGGARCLASTTPTTA